MTRCLVVLTIFSMLLAHSCGAFVFSRTAAGNVRKWQLENLNLNVHTNSLNRSTRAIRYYLGAYSATNTAAELNALRVAFDQWQLVPGTSLRFEEAGLTPAGIDVNLSDSSNVIFFAKSSTIVNGGMTDISGSPSAAFYSFLADGTMLEADIVLNAVDFAWFADFNNTNGAGQFIESTALFEIGRTIGLAHSPIGAATMFGSSDAGITSRAGLSIDDQAGVRSLYPGPASAGFSAIRGIVRKAGAPVWGALVLLERTAFDDVVAATLTRTNGTYELSGIPAGSYSIRLSPLDSTNAPHALLRGSQISTEFSGADPNFLPTASTLVTLVAGLTNTLDLTVTNGTPAFRISHMRTPTTSPGFYRWNGLPAALRPGVADIYFGVASPNLPASGATLAVTGDGISLGPVAFLPNLFGTGLNFMSAQIAVASNATPGLRSIMVQDGANAAYANGFLEILPREPDYDFDGLSDIFQRQYFPRFTVPEANPDADPDGDKYVNALELGAGTNPTNSQSVLKIDSVVISMSGAAVNWRSVSGKHYQLLYKPVLGSGNWAPVGAPVTASGPVATQTDPQGIAGDRFYRIQVLP